MNLEKITLKKIAITSICVQIFTILLMFIYRNCLSYLFIYLFIFYIFMIVVALDRFFFNETQHQEKNTTRVTYLFLSFPTIFIMLLMIFMLIDGNREYETENVELYDVKNNKLIKKEKLNIVNGEIIEHDTLAIVTNKDTIKFKHD